MTFRNPMLETWARGEPTLGVWCSIAGSFSAETAASAGYDYACVDLQHGAVDYADMLPMLQAIQLQGASPIVRVSWSERWMIMQALDAGAYGVIVPMIDTPGDAARAVSACRYPPAGERSFGPTRTAIANRTVDPDELSSVACIPMIETAAGLANLDGIAATPGVDALYVGPGDLALALGLPPRFAGEIPEHEEAIERIRQACDDNGIVAGVHCSSGAEARKRRQQGFTMITVAADSVLLRTAATEALAAARGDA